MPLLDKVLKRRLQSVSLVLSTLQTSLHDVTTENLNKGFASASQSFKEILETLEGFQYELTEYIILAFTGIVFLLSLLQTGVILSLNKRNRRNLEEVESVQTEKVTRQIKMINLQSKEKDDQQKEKEHKQKEKEEQQERELEEVKRNLERLRSTLAVTVTQAMETTFEAALNMTIAN